MAFGELLYGDNNRKLAIPTLTSKCEQPCPGPINAVKTGRKLVQSNSTLRHGKSAMQRIIKLAREKFCDDCWMKIIEILNEGGGSDG